MKFMLLFIGIILSGDAAAWGLQTHLYLAQQALPVVPPACAALVLAGACLPDLALAGRFLGTPAFRRTHQWSTLRRLAASPRSEEEQALATGYATHLLADVVAHNAFVPEHEARIARIPHFTHALAEWAMDEHIKRFLRSDPREVIGLHKAQIVPFVARHFGCGEALAARGVSWLASADGLLRASRLPSLCLRLLGPAGLDGYLQAAVRTLDGLEPALQGRLADWISSDPEGRACDEAAYRGPGEHVARIMQAEHHP